MTQVVADVPVRVDGVQLIGEMVGSGYRTPPLLVRRHDGQSFHLTPLLYLVLEAIDGHRTYTEVAERVSARFGRTVSASNIETLVDAKLRPLGLLLKADGGEPALKKSNPLLALRCKVSLTTPRAVDAVTAPFQPLFRTWVWIPVVLAFLAITGWVFFERGLGAATLDAFQRPHLLVLVFVVTILSAGFHEFGHAAAARYSGSRPGVIGAGIYLVWPAFYTDVSDSYRLGRLGRLRVDLGGLYFNAVTTVVVFGAWAWTGWDALLLLVATQILQMTKQLMPMLRFDGYHLLSDITGVPDLYQRMKPTLTSLLPGRWHDPKAAELKPWARAVVTFWVLLTVPLITLMLLAAVITLPHLVATAWVSAGVQVHDLVYALGDARLLDAAAAAVSFIALVFPVAATVMIVWRIGKRTVVNAWTWSAGRRSRRAAVVLLGLTTSAGLAWAWWPSADTYRPVQPDDRGTVTDLVSAAADKAYDMGTGGGNAASPAVLLAPDQTTTLVNTADETTTTRRTRNDPHVAPTPATTSTATSTTTSASATPPATAPGVEPISLTSTEPNVQTTDATVVSTDGLSPQHPQLALVVVPHAQSGPPIDGKPQPTSSSTATPTTETVWDNPGQGEQPSGAWVFPFDEPLPPGVGDAQALAVNTQDGSVTYDVALALVWEREDTYDEVIDNTNEAYAFASCTDCTTVAVSFQVVFVVGHANAITPQNYAGAVNYECDTCTTVALAQQLVVTIPEMPDEQQQLALLAVWNDLVHFGRTIQSYDLATIQAYLDQTESQIVQIMQAQAATTPTTVSTSTPTTSAPPVSTTVSIPSPSSTSSTTSPTDTTATASSAPPETTMATSTSASTASPTSSTDAPTNGPTSTSSTDQLTSASASDANTTTSTSSTSDASTSLTGDTCPTDSTATTSTTCVSVTP